LPAGQQTYSLNPGQANRRSNGNRIPTFSGSCQTRLTD
jgi:hypothetical protein